jgi:glycerophosphoryl diester phosphodiesterase
LLGICSAFPNKTYFAHRGGNISRYHENTLEIFLDSASQKLGIEIDLMQLGSGEIVAFHDSNTIDLTGKSYELINTPLEIVRTLTYLTYIDNRKYASSPKIPLLMQVLEVICSVNNLTNLWFDIKYSFGANYIVALLDALDASPCACDSEQKIVVEVFRDVTGLSMLKSYMANRRCNQIFGAISYYEHQIGMSFEKLETEMDNFAKYANVIDFPVSFINEYPEILSYNANLNLCNSVYGDNQQKMNEAAKNPFVDALVYNFYDSNS